MGVFRIDHEHGFRAKIGSSKKGDLSFLGNPNIILPHDPRRQDSEPCFSCFQKPHEDERGAYKDFKLEQDACHYPFKEG
jgi:hypothetical protein